MAIDPKQKELWLREFRLNGFAILPDLLPRDLVISMYDDLHPFLLAEHMKSQRGESNALRGPARMAFDVSHYADLMKGALADPRYRQHPVIEELVDAILGKWKHGWTQVECCWKGSEYMQWHADQTPEETPDLDRQDGPVRVTYNIPLVDFTWSSGPIELLPGSHLLPRSFHVFSYAELPHLDPVIPPRRRGDALLRDGNLLHRGTPNLTDDPRPMLDQTYKVAP